MRKTKIVCVVAALAMVAGCSPFGLGSNGPSPTEAAAQSQFATIDAAMVTTGDAGKLTASGLDVTIPQLGDFPALVLAQENLRNEILQHTAWQAATDVKISTRVIASGQHAIGLLTSALIGGEEHQVAVYYHVASNTAVAPAALIEPAKWAAFTEAVGAAPGGQALASGLDKRHYPLGEAPVIGFAGNGDLVVQAGKTAVVLGADQAAGWLTPFGMQVLGAATHPSKAAPPSAVTKADAALFGTATTGATRAAITLGPDCATLKCVALTFDDGPVTATDDLLSTLRDKKAPATFFTLGNSVDKAENVVRRAASLGNQIGWHSVTHKSLPSLKDDRIGQELGAGATRLFGLIGSRPLLFRPPYGAHDKRVDQLIGQHKMANIMWSVDTRDWDKSKLSGAALTQAVVRVAVDTAKPGGIVLMHDIHDTSRAAVAAIVDGLRAKGFTLVTVGELPGWQKFAWGKSYCTAPASVGTCW